MTSVLISGASIAGPALASWLHRYGFEVTVIERAAELRSGGQNVDVRGAGREVARRMGLEDAIRAATTGEAGVRFVDADDRTIASFAAGSSDSDGPTAELEILRGDLARLLVEQTADEVEYVFGDHITGLEDDGTGVQVAFAHGAARSFDLVVAADGIRSSTRALVLGDEPVVKPLGMYTAYLTIPRTETDTAWARWFNAPGGRTSTLRPDNVGTTRATLSFMSEPRGYERWDSAGQRDVLRQRFAGRGLGGAADPRRARRVRRLLRGDLPGAGAALVGRADGRARRRGLLRVTDQRDGHQPGARRGVRAGRRARHATPTTSAPSPRTSRSCGRTWSRPSSSLRARRGWPIRGPGRASPGSTRSFGSPRRRLAQRVARKVFAPKAERIELPTYRPATAPTG